ncbi:MAG: RagB/SusD family nutrient uptake outer membrane protein [Bacteroidetes bacterium]|nr:RagB/SusD family nutrient uptake outer membrane protein [Bacteroidota bacterium]
MKKRTLYILLPLLVAVTLYGCKKGFLDRNPPDQLAAGTFWKTQADADLALTGVYAYLVQGYNYTSSTNTGQGWGSGAVYWETLSDNAFSGAFSPTSTGAIEATNGNILQDAWQTPYRAIEACNTFLANIGRVNMDAKTMNKYMAEVRFIRAHYYFLLTQLYGDVVLAMQPLGKDSSNYKLGRTAKSVVMDTIFNDLSYAISNLPDTAYAGHVVKGTAQGYLTKWYLVNQRWTEAAATAQAIMTANKFKLYTGNGGYRGLFLKSGPMGGQLNNQEIMFSGRYSIPAQYSPADYLSTYSASLQPLPNLVNDYECTDGLPISSSPLYNASAPYVNRDPRLLATILVPGVLFKGGIVFVASQVGSASGFLNKKGVDSTRATVIGTQSDQDWVYLRFADVLLMYAEAQNEAAGPDATVYNAVNAVRGRVNMPPLPAGITQDSMRTRIRHERRIELAMEGHRYFDLKRWKLDRVILPALNDPGTTPTNGALRTFPLRDTLWPVPQTEIDIARSYGNGNFKQTPGYN